MSNASWQIAPLPVNEEARLTELCSYQILDTPPEIAFDRLTRMAARHFDMPVALVSLVDRERQWFKSHYGLDITETPRDLAFCAHVILQDDVMVVCDTRQDPRFAGHPLVTGAPDIRFYAGAPLTTSNGHKLGTVCVIDSKPHPEFGEDEKKELAELASIAVDEMELRLSAQQATQDLQALRTNQVEMEAARRKTEQTSREKMQFVATISHELRTPMNGILGMAYLLGDTPLNETQREYIDTINHSAENLLLLLNDVLDMSKIEAGELILEQKPFDIKTSFAQTIKLLKPLADKKGNVLLQHIDGSTPDLIVGDQGRFCQIVTNLVGNAVKFTEAGIVEAKLSCAADIGMIYCEVKDTGIGIPENRHGQIFEKFTQGDAAITQKYGGTGLGLAITKHLVMILGGEIGFESREKAGSRFWFTLPISRVGPSMARHTNKTVPKSDTGRIDASHARVLIAEDHPVNQMFLGALLKKFGFGTVNVAENGLEVMEAVQSTGYDAIFMDCKMPEQDGYETTHLIRMREKEAGQPMHTPIIAMTANAMIGDREACFAAGMDEYLTKPLQPDLVKETLGQWFVFEAAAAAPAAIAAPPKPAIAPVDFSRLEIVATTDRDKAALVALFFRLARELIGTMEQSRRDEEFTRWKNAAHNLKGSAANMGMRELENICRQAEKSQSLTYGQRSALLRRMRDELDHIKAFISLHDPALLTS